MSLGSIVEYSTKTFVQVYATASAFLTDATAKFAAFGKTPEYWDDTTGARLYYILYAQYGNHPIAYTDETQFAFQLFSVTLQYFDLWLKKIDIQDKLRGLTEDELQTGAIQIYNKASNPSQIETEGGTLSKDEIPYVDEQNTAKHKRSKLEAYNLLWGLLRANATEDLLRKYRPLFRQFVSDDYCATYESEE